MIASEIWPDRELSEGDLQTAPREVLEARLRYVQDKLHRLEEWESNNSDYDPTPDEWSKLEDILNGYY